MADGSTPISAPESSSATSPTAPVTTDTNSQIAGGKSVSAATPIKSMGDLKEKIGEKLYDKFMMNIAMMIVRDMKKHNARLIKKIKEGRT
jgi:hypothetical protein